MTSNSSSYEMEIFELTQELNDLYMVHQRLLDRFNKLDEENTMLKNKLSEWAMNMSHEQYLKHKKATSETMSRWSYYHQHKQRIKDGLEENVSWMVIKKITDELYLKEKKT